MLPQPVLADIVELLQRRSAAENDSGDDDKDEDGDDGSVLSRLRMLHAHLKQDEKDEEESDEEDSSETELGPHTKEELVALIKDSF